MRGPCKFWLLRRLRLCTVQRHLQDGLLRHIMPHMQTAGIAALQMRFVTKSLQPQHLQVLCQLFDVCAKVQRLLRQLRLLEHRLVSDTLLLVIDPSVRHPTGPGLHMRHQRRMRSYNSPLLWKYKVHPQDDFRWHPDLLRQLRLHQQ